MCAASKDNLDIATTLIEANANVNATDKYGRTALFEAVVRENMKIIELLIENNADVNVSCKYKDIDKYTLLMNAASNGNLEIATALIQANANVNASDEYGRTALCEALYQENKEIIELLIKNNADVNVSCRYKGINKCTPLMCAVSEGNLGITTALIQANANVNAADEYGRTALFEAIDMDNKEIVELLITNKADVNVSCEYNGINNYTPLMCAASKGNIEIATALMQANANANARNQHGTTALFEAVVVENKKIVELLIENNADVNVSCQYKGINEYTPLMCAVFKGNLEITTALVQANADVNASEELGRTALSKAMYKEDMEIVKLLIENKADVNLSCKYNVIEKNTALFRYGVSKGNLDITAALVQANADVNATDEYGRSALFEAVCQENKEIVKLLIENKADVNVSCQNTQYTPLMCAASKGNLDITTTLIEANANVNATDKFGRTALFEAVDIKNLKLLELLIDNDADVNVSCKYKGIDQYTPLMCAVSEGNLGITTALIQANANVNATDEHGRTALFFAVVRESIKIVKLLIENKADVNVSCQNTHYTPLMFAASKDNLDIATTLIEANANVNTTDKYGRTALFFAVVSKNVRIVELLIENKADINLSCNYNDIDKYTLLMNAASKGNLEIATALIQANANVNAADEYGRTALFEAIDMDNKEIVKLLITNKADVNLSCEYNGINNYTPLMCAASKCNIEIATALMQANANVNAGNQHGRTALFEAVVVENKEIVELLIENIADVNISCEYNGINNYTPLMCAASRNNIEITTSLIQANANVNARNQHGRTALFEAVVVENKEIVELLIANIADVNISCEYNGINNYTPLMCAASKGNIEITTALIQGNANLNTSDEYGKPALFKAVYQENKEIVKLLIEKGGNVDVPFTYQGFHGCTILMYAAEKGNIEIMRLLLQYGAKVNAKDIKGRSPLFYAIDGDYPLNTANFLRGNGARLRESDKCYFSALSFCIETLCAKKCLSNINLLELFDECYGKSDCIFSSIIDMLFIKLPNIIVYHSKITKYILPNGIRLAKHYASNQQHRELLEQVLHKYSTVNFQSLQTFQEMLAVLIQLGADPNSVDSYGNTALHYALKLPYYGASEDLTVKIISNLVEHGSRFDIRNHDDYTPLLYGLSIWNNKANWDNFKAMKSVCQLSPKYNLHANETEGNGASVFHIILGIFGNILNEKDLESQESVLQDLISLLKLLSPPHIIQRVTVNKRDNKLVSPLHLWASLSLPNENYTRPLSGKRTFESLLKDIFDHLQACGIQLDDRDCENRTPLHYCRTWSAVNCLVHAGARLNDHESKGRSPLLAAAHNEVFKVKTGCFFPDVTDDPKSFFKQCIEMGLDLWYHDNYGESILSLLLSSNSFELAQGLVEISCELNPSVVEQLLLALCNDKATHTLWKSYLVSSILRCTTRSTEMDLCPSLRSCCLNIKRLIEMGKLHLGKEKKTFDVGISALSQLSVHLDIANQLRLYGANSECCQDLCAQNVDVRSLLTRTLDFDQAPLIIPWTSYSEKHKEKLERVARRQNVVSVNAYWYHKESIGSGAFGDVFAGICDKDGREVAIKKIAKRTMTRPQDKREVINLTALADCPQVVKYICFDDNDKDFAYIVLELMEGHLDGYFASFPSELHQSISLCRDLLLGVKYLHDHEILHRDLKPGNILYKVHPKLCLKIADFGLSSRVTTNPGTTVLGTNAGTRCWIAPEVISFRSYQHTQKSDNFSSGLLLHYILSPQRHPFSPVDCSNKTKEIIELETRNNMMNDTMEGWDFNVSPEATNLIKGLLSKIANERPSAADSVSHPLFWRKKKKLEFLYAVGNQPEIERPLPTFGPLPPVESDLEVFFPAIVKYPTWDDAGYTHMPAIYAEMTKPITRGRGSRPARKYNTGSVTQLIRFVRNAISHVSEASRPTAIRKQILEDAVFLDYFPDLVMEVYKLVIIKHGWDTREEIKHAMSSEDK